MASISMAYSFMALITPLTTLFLSCHSRSNSGLPMIEFRVLAASLTARRPTAGNSHMCKRQSATPRRSPLFRKMAAFFSHAGN